MDKSIVLMTEEGVERLEVLVWRDIEAAHALRIAQSPATINLLVMIHQRQKASPTKRDEWTVEVKPGTSSQFRGHRTRQPISSQVAGEVKGEGQTVRLVLESYGQARIHRDDVLRLGQWEREQDRQVEVNIVDGYRQPTTEPPRTSQSSEASGSVQGQTTSGASSTKKDEQDPCRVQVGDEWVSNSSGRSVCFVVAVGCLISDPASRHDDVPCVAYKFIESGRTYIMTQELFLEEFLLKSRTCSATAPSTT